jgi:hypothetical protein
MRKKRFYVTTSFDRGIHWGITVTCVSLDALLLHAGGLVRTFRNLSDFRIKIMDEQGKTLVDCKRPPRPQEVREILEDIPLVHDPKSHTPVKAIEPKRISFGPDIDTERSRIIALFKQGRITRSFTRELLKETDLNRSDITKLIGTNRKENHATTKRN